jgi:SOS-response transcriptional repressor LexA
VAVTRLPLSSSAVRVLGALLTHEGRYPPTLRELGAAAGLRSTASTHACLWDLRRAGLVDWEDGRQGTLRALVDHAYR